MCIKNLTSYRERIANVTFFVGDSEETGALTNPLFVWHASARRSKVEASKAVVHDISGGCGSMFKIEVESPLFRGKGLVAQHRMVKDALKAEIADMHGLTLLTRPSPE